MYCTNANIEVELVKLGVINLHAWTINVNDTLFALIIAENDSVCLNC